MLLFQSDYEVTYFDPNAADAALNALAAATAQTQMSAWDWNMAICAFAMEMDQIAQAPETPDDHPEQHYTHSLQTDVIEYHGPVAQYDARQIPAVGSLPRPSREEARGWWDALAQMLRRMQDGGRLNAAAGGAAQTGVITPTPAPATPPAAARLLAVFGPARDALVPVHVVPQYPTITPPTRDGTSAQARLLYDGVYYWVRRESYTPAYLAQTSSTAAMEAAIAAASPIASRLSAEYLAESKVAQRRVAVGAAVAAAAAVAARMMK